MGAQASLRPSGAVAPYLLGVFSLCVVPTTFYCCCFTTTSGVRGGLFTSTSSGSHLSKLLEESFWGGRKTRHSAAREGRLLIPRNGEENEEEDVKEERGLGGVRRTADVAFEPYVVDIKDNPPSLNDSVDSHKNQGEGQAHEGEQKHGELWGGSEELKEEGEGNVSSLPRCYTTPAADPSKGTWRKTDGGVRDSPVTVERRDWPSYKDTVFGGLAKCSKKWVEEHAGQGLMPYYTWEAEDCFLDTVDKGKFCAVMAGRKGILFAGDSLSRHMTTTLASVLRANNTIGGDDGRCHDDEWSACSGVLRLRFQRNDFLDPRTERLFENNTRGFKSRHCNFPDISKTLCTIFADDETLGEFDTLVVNSGAHVRPPDEYSPVIEAASKAITASMRRLHGNDAILVARNTATGHWECNERMFEGPVDGDVAARLVAAAPEQYKYPAFRESNKLFEKAFVANRSSGQDEDDFGWVLLDAYTPSFVRADMHMGGNGPDCLHYCMHGPMDHWVRLLYNIIIAAKRAKSV